MSDERVTPEGVQATTSGKDELAAAFMAAVINGEIPGDRLTEPPEPDEE
jgi:hypothetical protein